MYEDGAAVLQHIERSGTGTSSAVEEPGGIVEVSDEQVVALGDPHATVVELDIGGGDAGVDDGKSGDRDSGGSQRRSRREGTTMPRYRTQQVHHFEPPELDGPLPSRFVHRVRLSSRPQ